MDISTKEGKERLIKEMSPGTRVLRNSALSFIFGGLICGLGEGIRHLLLFLGLDRTVATTLVSLTFVLLASLATALGVFDKLARYACAGALVPITGFSNAVTSCALDAKSEGFILGVGSKIFTVSGPVILYALLSGAVYGVFYYIFK